MGTYTAQVIPSKILKDLLENNWDTLQGNVPIPEIIEVNVPEEEYRKEVSEKGLIAIRADVGGERETLRNAWAYKDIKWEILLDLWVTKNRQRLYDLLYVVRGICHSNLHNSSVTQFQVLRYLSFVELTTEFTNIWRGTIRVSLESAGIPLDKI